MHRTRNDRFRYHHARNHDDGEFAAPKHGRLWRSSQHDDEPMPDARIDWRALLDEERESTSH